MNFYIRMFSFKKTKCFTAFLTYREDVFQFLNTHRMCHNYQNTKNRSLHGGRYVFGDNAVLLKGNRKKSLGSGYPITDHPADHRPPPPSTDPPRFKIESRANIQPTYVHKQMCTIVSDLNWGGSVLRGGGGR